MGSIHEILPTVDEMREVLRMGLSPEPEQATGKRLAFVSARIAPSQDERALETARALIQRGLEMALLVDRRDPDTGRSLPLTEGNRQYCRQHAERALQHLDPDLRLDIASDVIGMVVADFCSRHWTAQADELREFGRELLSVYEAELSREAR